MVADATTRIAAGQVIEGRGWHQSKWSKDPKEMVDGFPTHKALSEVSPNHPVVLGHANGHSALANEAAMRALGINFTTDAPEGGVSSRINAVTPRVFCMKMPWTSWRP